MLTTKNPATAKMLETGKSRLKMYQNRHKASFGAEFTGRLVEFGCGAGGFMMSATDAGIDAHGVEVDASRHEQFLYHARHCRFSQTDRFTLYDGRLLPYASNSFDGCYSWFVFEHVIDPQVSLREISRVLKPGGTLVLHADDVRNAWDGHAMRPWPPYLPREFAGAYLDGLGLPEQTEFVSKWVVYVSAPAICDILTTLGMEIVYANAAPAHRLMSEGLYVTSDAEARALGQKVKAEAHHSPAENLTVFARKL